MPSHANSLLPTSIKTRILHLRASQFVGGPEKQILHHAGHVRSREREIWIGSFRDGSARPALLDRAEELGLPTLEFSSGRFDLRTIFELARAIRQHHISVLCTHGYKANIIGWAAARLTGCAQIAYARGWTSENWRIRFYDKIDRFVLHRTEWVVCVSRAQADRLTARRRRKRAPVVIPNTALLVGESVTLPIARQPIRKSLGLPEDAFLVGAAGRLSVEKGHLYLLRAIPALIRHIPKLQVLLLGEGAERKRFEHEVAQLGLQHCVRLIGFVDDVRPWIQACDVLVNPSLSEGVPNVVLEAMALGTPVVATSVGGVPDLLQDLSSGLIVPSGNSVALANAIHIVFASPAMRVRLTQNAQTRAQDFSPERQNQRLLELYAAALQTAQAKWQSTPIFRPHADNRPDYEFPSAVSQ